MQETMQTTISPVDGSVYLERELATPEQIERTLSSAQEAQLEWKRVPLAERAAICTQMVDAILSHTSELAAELSWQMGRPIRYAPLEIEGGFAERARYMIAIADKALADVRPEPKAGFARFIRREPLGVVLTLAPWNYPYLTSVNSIIPAIMAGNAVILKHSEQTPLVAERYAEAFETAGLPAGVFQYLHTTHEEVAKMVADARIGFVAFTGSVAGGHAVQRAASERFIGAGMELGGKDPAYVRPDADLSSTIESVVDGIFFNSGQSCCALERIYVHEDVYDAFVEGAVELAKGYRLGNPLKPETTLGPMVRTRNAELVREHIAEALERGATPLLEPAAFPAARAGTPYLAPQLLVNVTHDMRVMREETFGPVAGIMKVSGDAEAVKLMNDSPYGLTASIWTRDAGAATAIGEQLHTGTCFMNRCDYPDPTLAWTGVGDSGRGCSLSVLGYEQLTRPKSFHLKLPENP